MRRGFGLLAAGLAAGAVLLLPAVASADSDMTHNSVPGMTHDDFPGMTHDSVPGMTHNDFPGMTHN